MIPLVMPTPSRRPLSYGNRLPRRATVLALLARLWPDLDPAEVERELGEAGRPAPVRRLLSWMETRIAAHNLKCEAQARRVARGVTPGTPLPTLDEARLALHREHAAAYVREKRTWSKPL